MMQNNRGKITELREIAQGNLPPKLQDIEDMILDEIQQDAANDKRIQEIYERAKAGDPSELITMLQVALPYLKELDNWNEPDAGIFQDNKLEAIKEDVGRLLDHVGVIKRTVAAVVSKQGQPAEKPAMSLAEAVAVISTALKTDQGYYMGWKANIATSITDTYQCDEDARCTHGIHLLANRAAENFLKLLTS